MKIKSFKKVLSMVWSKKTCVPSLREKWNENNKSLGQCDVTSLVVNDYYGGKIMHCMTSVGSHYYNLIDGEIVDLTENQFAGEIPLYKEGQERTREYLLSNEDTKKRYLLLLMNIKCVFARQEIRDLFTHEEIMEIIIKRKKKVEK